MEATEKTVSRVDSVTDMLSGKLSDILDQKNKGVIQENSDCIVATAVRKMCDEKVGGLLVVEEEILVGIFTERDLMSRVVAEGLDPDKIAPSVTLVSEAANLMSQNSIRHLPVLRDGKLYGVISVGDILAWKLCEQEFILLQLEDYFLKS